MPPTSNKMSTDCEKSNLKEGALLGLGNPLLDISANVDEEFLKSYNLKANDAILAGEEHMKIYADVIDKYDVEYTTGGSVQNTLRVAQWILEVPRVTTFFGAVGLDKYSKILEDQTKSDGVDARYQYIDDVPTGRCCVLITENGIHRSLCTSLGAANKFTVDHLQKPENRKLIEKARYFYISGYFLPVSLPSVLEIAKHSLEHDKPLIVNISAPFVGSIFKDLLMQVMPYIDILFGNETEAETFAEGQNFGTKDLEQIALMICDLPKQNESRSRICVITQGCDPVIVAKDGKVTKFDVDPVPKEKIVDTNGAGDAFCGGFLAQYILGRGLSDCIKCGNWAARQIVQRSGLTFEGEARFQA